VGATLRRSTADGTNGAAARGGKGGTVYNGETGAGTLRRRYDVVLFPEVGRWCIARAAPDGGTESGGISRIVRSGNDDAGRHPDGFQPCDVNHLAEHGEDRCVSVDDVASAGVASTKTGPALLTKEGRARGGTRWMVTEANLAQALRGRESRGAISRFRGKYSVTATRTRPEPRSRWCGRPTTQPGSGRGSRTADGPVPRRSSAAREHRRCTRKDDRSKEPAQRLSSARASVGRRLRVRIRGRACDGVLLRAASRREQARNEPKDRGGVARAKVMGASWARMGPAARWRSGGCWFNQGRAVRG